MYYRGVRVTKTTKKTMLNRKAYTEVLNTTAKLTKLK